MSKNMTRKGLAIGAGFALVATGFVSVPAYAATLATSVHLGSSLNTLVGATHEIDLATQLSADATANEASLKYRVLNPSGATLGFGASNNATASATGTVQNSDTDGSFYSTATGAEITTATTSSTDFVVVPGNFGTGEAGVAAAYNLLRIWVTSTESATITVQAFLDTSAPSSHVMDSVEDKGPVTTVNFYKASAVTWSTAIDKPAATDTSVGATVTTSPSLNGNYLNGNVTVNFTRQGSTATIESAAASWSDVTNSWTASVSLGATINWAGMPNWYALKDVGTGGVSSTTVTYETTLATGLANGDTVIINASNNGADIATAGTIAGVSGNTFTATVGSAATLAADTADTGYLAVVSKKLTTSEASTTSATYTTAGAHGLRVGDFVTIDSSRDGIFDRTTRVSVSAVPTTTTFSVSLATAQTAATASAADTGSVTFDSFFKAAVGTYTAQAKWNSAVQGAVSDSGSINVAAASTKVTTVASANLQGVDKSGAAGTILVKAGTLSATVTLTVLDSSGAAVGAGRPVKVGTLTPTGPVTVNGRSTSGETLLTNASGQVTLTVASTTGTAGHSVVVQVTPENVTGANAGFTMTWAAATVGLVDLNTTDGLLTDGTTYQRKVAEDGSYELKLMAADQWFTVADSASYRVLVSGDGAAGGAYPLVSGMTTVKISDLDIATTWNTTVKLQRLSSGSWVDSTSYTFASDDISSAAVVLGADGSNAYGSTADLSDAVAKVALVEYDLRSKYTAKPAYENDVIVNGRFTNSSTGVALEGVAVTISGPTSILFDNGQVAKRGSITVLTNASGQFEVTLYSTTAQTDTVITVAGLGASATTKVTFTGIGVGEGTKLDVTTPANVKPASTFQVKAKLSDVYGNGVDTAAGRVKVTYSGPGIVFGTLPDQTDANGELMFSVLLGSNDTGNVVVTVSYDQNGDADYVDAKDLNTTKTITVGTGAAAGAGKVNVGSFNGKLVVYASGLSGKTISWKVGGTWGKQVAASNYAVFNRPTPRAGVTVSVNIYVDGVLTLTKSVVTR